MQHINGSSTTSVKNIAILGATGNVGKQILQEFIDHNKSNPSKTFNILALTRDSSLEKTVRQFNTYLNDASTHLQVKSIDIYSNQTALAKILRDTATEVLISTITTLSTNDQISMVDACVASGTVKRFFPSEFGVDTSSRSLVEKYLPVAQLKLEIVEHLKQVAVNTNGRFSWTGVIVGSFFDWGLSLPGVIGFDLAQNQVTVFDGGDVKYEATNLAQIGRAVVACLVDAKTYEESASQYVYVNSFNVTQNQVIALIEKFTGRTMGRTNVKSTEVYGQGKAIMDKNGGLNYFRNYEPTSEAPYAPGTVQMIWGALYGGEKSGSLNQYSQRSTLWNEWLGLPKEDMEDTVKGVVEKLGLLKG